MNIKSAFITGFVVLLAFILLLPGCNEVIPQNSSILAPTSPIASPPEESAPSSPIAVDLSFPNGAPALNREAEMKVIVTAFRGVKNMQVRIVLPESLSLVSGKLAWTGSIPLGEKADAIKAVVKSVKPGNFAIQVHQYINPNKPEGQSSIGFAGG